ncbi:PUR family DNA/RNA-binding protein [Paracrocinitomix mangrovi]|uniref:DUF3276 family protein n=1 Tax=Paracrocinitomix mangrovi TaxID=2862509 RepID=UPI001C8D13D1|nr:DUF3276 family protein [Paracrocinitomix mangrovi]UKN02208.1 PUR family DNA/RNA-binding protein [Paracrocinitomix mangrovi]
MNERNDEVFSKRVKAGKRTYFFDVKTTRGKDLYLTITESKRTGEYDGRPEYEKHKIFLYKEDFEKFNEGMTEALGKIKELWDTGEYKKPEERTETEEEEVTFEEL